MGWFLLVVLGRLKWKIANREMPRIGLPTNLNQQLREIHHLIDWFLRCKVPQPMII